MLKRNETSGNIFKKEIGLDARCEGSGGAEVLDIFIMWLASLDTSLASVIHGLPERKNHIDHRHELYSDTYGKYLVMRLSSWKRTVFCVCISGLENNYA